MLSTSPLTLALVLNGVIAAALATYAWPRRHVPGARPFILMNVFAAAASLAYAAHFQATDAAMRDFWIKMRFTAQTGLPIAVLLLCFELSDRALVLSRRATVMLWAIPVAFSATVWTNPWHHLVLKTTASRPGAPVMTLGHDPGPLFWVLIGFAFLSIVFGLLTLLDHALRRGGVARMQVL